MLTFTACLSLACIFHWVMRSGSANRVVGCEQLDGDIATLKEHLTSMPLTQVRLPGVAGNFSPLVSFLYSLPYGVRTPTCAVACIKICAHAKEPVVHVRVR